MTTTVLSCILMWTILLSGFTQETEANDSVMKAQKRAISIWMKVMFLDYYTRFNNNYSYDDIDDGEISYNEQKSSGFSESGVAGLVDELNIQELQNKVKLWASKKFISEAEKREQLIVLGLTSGMFKTIREHVNVLDNGDIYYGVTGLIKLGMDKGSIAYSFRKFKLNVTPTIRYNRGQNCTLWGILCKTDFDFRNAEGEFGVEKSTNLASYMHYEVLNQFREETHYDLERIGFDARLSKKFLPNAIKQALQEIEKYPHVRPDELFKEDPFNGDKYDL